MPPCNCGKTKTGFDVVAKSSGETIAAAVTTLTEAQKQGNDSGQDYTIKPHR